MFLITKNKMVSILSFPSATTQKWLILHETRNRFAKNVLAKLHTPNLFKSNNGDMRGRRAQSHFPPPPRFSFISPCFADFNKTCTNTFVFSHLLCNFLTSFVQIKPILNYRRLNTLNCCLFIFSGRNRLIICSISLTSSYKCVCEIYFS